MPSVIKKPRLDQVLARKVCVITGGAGLLGKAFSTVVAYSGAVTIVLDIQEESGEKVVAEIRRQTGSNAVFFITCDITDERCVKKAHDAIIKKHGRIDALVNNAYPHNKNYGRKFEDVTYEDFCENLSAHVGGYFLMTRIFSETMKTQKSGVIINLGSIYGAAAPRFEIYDGTTMTMPVEYAAIKGGIINLTRYFASYLGKYNIRVNCLSPGGVGEANHPKNFMERYNQKVLLSGRMAKTDDLAGVLVFLLSDASRYMTGQNIVVDGGWSL